MITDDKMEAALHYLAQSDEAWANAKSAVEAANYARKSMKAEIKLEKEGANNIRDDIAEASETYRSATAAHVDAIRDFSLIDAKRKRAELTIEVWRSQNASRRKGNV